MTAASPRLSTRATAGPGWLLANVATVTGRNLRRLVRVPTLIAFATAQPVMFVLLFTYAFGGAIHPPGVERRLSGRLGRRRLPPGGQECDDNYGADADSCHGRFPAGAAPDRAKTAIVRPGRAKRNTADQGADDQVAVVR